MSNKNIVNVSLSLPDLADMINDHFTLLTGEPVSFVLVLQVDGVAQYVSNTKREDGMALLESLFERWKTKRAAIPAHYNPDLKQ